MKKVLFITASLGKGGAERVLSRLANFFSEDYEVTIACLSEAKIAYPLNTNVSIVELSSNNRFNRYLMMPYWVFSLIKLRLRMKPSVVISFVGRVNVISMLSFIGSMSKMLCSERNDPLKDGRSDFLLNVTALLYRRVGRLVCQTNEVEAFFRHKKIQRISILPNPIDIPLVKAYSSQESVVEVVAVGRLVEQKNYLFMLDVIRYIVFENLTDRKFILKIWGAGSLFDSLKNTIDNYGVSDYVKLMGSTDNIESKLVESDIYIQTSLYEGLSNAMMEAGAIGLPIITTSVNGVDQIVKDNFSGYVVCQDSIREFAEKLIHLIENPDLRKDMGLYGHSLSQKFSSENVLNQWKDLIVRLK